MGPFEEKQVRESQGSEEDRQRGGLINFQFNWGSVRRMNRLGAIEQSLHFANKVTLGEINEVLNTEPNEPNKRGSSSRDEQRNALLPRPHTLRQRCLLHI